MAIRIPIVSEFDDRGLAKATREFQSLETTGQKAGFAIQKAAVPAALALGGLAVAAGSAYKAFAEDQAAATKLATTLKNVTQASDAQIQSVEKYISATSRAAAVADDELRPALDALVRGTGDVTKAQDLLNLALDVSAGTGKDLQAVSEALSKAYNGQLGPLAKLDPALRDLVKSGASADEVFAALATTFKDQAAKQAGTAEGKMKNLSIQMGELKESIGQAVAPLIDKLLPGLTGLSDWASNNTDTIVIIAAAVAGFAASIVLARSAMVAWNAIAAITTAANAILGASFSALWVATGVGVILAIVAAVVLLNEKFGFMDEVISALGVAWEEFYNFVTPILDLFWSRIQQIIATFTEAWNMAFELVKGYFTTWYGVVSALVALFTGDWKKAGQIIKDTFKSVAQSIVNFFVSAINSVIGMINFVIEAYNKLPFAPDISLIPKLKAPDLFKSSTEYLGPRLEEPLMNKSGLTSVTVNIAGSVTTEQDLIEAIRRGLVDSQRNGNQLVYSTIL